MGKRERVLLVQVRDGFRLGSRGQVADDAARQKREGGRVVTLLGGRREGGEEVLVRRVERGVVLHGEGQAGLALGGGELFAGGVKAKLGRWGFVTGKRR